MWHSAKEKSKATNQKSEPGQVTKTTADITAEPVTTTIPEETGPEDRQKVEANGVANGLANGVAGNQVNSPPGAPPSRPPPPRQESIDKFLKRTASLDAERLMHVHTFMTVCFHSC